MDALPLRQAGTQNPQPQRLPFHKAGHSQTTIDLYLRPIAKVKQGQNDIRNYFSPVAGTSPVPKGESRSPAKVLVTPKPSHGNNGVGPFHTPSPSPSLQSPVESTPCIPESQQFNKRVPDIPIRVRKHNHVKSAVLPRFDPFFDNDEFPHSTSPMAPRVTDVVRHSLVPKPLNIKMPPPTDEASRSPSQTTSSPSSVGDADTASLDGEGREAPSFKQTYMSVHSRQNTIDSPLSPLMALRDPSPKPLRQRVDRPAALRSITAPEWVEPCSTDSIIYFLPEISPTSDASADEREPLMGVSNSRTKANTSIRDVFRRKRQAVKLGNVSPAQKGRREDVLKEKAVTISPGMRRRDALMIEVCY